MTDLEIDQALQADPRYRALSKDEQLVKREAVYKELGRPVPKPEPTLLETIRQRPVSTFGRPILEGLGTVGGVIATTPLGPVGQAAGGALGYAGGSALADVAETYAGERQPPASLLEAGHRTLDLMKEGGLFESGGRLISKGAEVIGSTSKSLIRSMISGQTQPLTPEQKLIVNTAQEMGLHLRPSEVTQADTAAQLEQYARQSLFGRGKFQKLDEANSKAMLDFYDTYAEKVFGQQQSPQELGRLVQAAVEGQVVPDVQAVNRGLFHTLQQQTGDASIVSTAQVLPKAKELLEAFDEKVFPKSHGIAAKIYELASQRGATTGLRVKRIGGREPEAAALDEAVGIISGQPATRTPLEGLKIREVSEATRTPKTLTFMEAHDIRSLLLDLTRTGEVLSSREKAVAARLADSMDSSMETAARRFDEQHGTSVLHDWRIANASIRASHELFDSAVIRKAMSASPEDITKVAFTRNAISETDRVLEALKQSPNGISHYRQAAFRELTERAKTADGVISPQKLWEAAYGKGGVGGAVMSRTFGEHAQDLERFLAASKNMNIRSTYSNAASGQSSVTWMDRGIILSLPSSAVVGLGGYGTVGAIGGASAGLYIVGVDQLARLVNSPRGLRLLTEYSKLRPTTKDGIRVGGLLLKELANTTTEE